MSKRLEPIRVLHIITRMIVGGAQENTLLSAEGVTGSAVAGCAFQSGYVVDDNR